MNPAERALDVRVPRTRCPYCHAEIALGVEPIVCAACHALHHRECLIEHGACSACGAGHASVPRASAPARTQPRPASGGRVPLVRSHGVALVTSIVLQVIAIGVALSAVAIDHGPDLLLGYAWAVAAAIGIGVGARQRSARRVWTAFFLALGAFLIAWPLASARVRHDHAAACLGWGSGVLLLGIAVELAARLAPRAPAPGKEEVEAKG